MIQDRSAVIVGAGPAGMSAAITLAECGLHPTVIDENANAGGQIYRQPPSAFRTPPSDAMNLQSARGTQLRQRFQDLAGEMEVLHDAKVWAIFDGRRLALTTTDRWQLIDAERLVLATGAYEFVPPFPGWTIPGVMTPGAAQLLIKSMRLLPGQRALVAGTGPFLLVVACCLQDAGVEVVGVVECIKRTEAIRSLPSLIHDLGLLRQGWQYLRQLKRVGVPIHTGHVVVQAEGEEGVKRVRFAPCDGQWRPDRGRTRTVDVDTLCVGYGFVPRAELAQLAGCEMRWADELGGWIPILDENLATSERGVWVAGDGGGVAGAAVAEDEGTLVGLAVARDCGALDEPSFQRLRRSVSSRLNRRNQFRHTLDKLSQIRPGLSELASDDTLVCRCEELKRSEVEAAIDAGCTTNRTLKVATRLGMGPCQGRMCWPAMARFMGLKTGKSLEEIGPLSVRPPIVPVTLGALAEMEDPDAITQGGSSR